MYCPCDFSTSGVALNKREVELEQRRWGAGNDGGSSCMYCPCDFSTSGVALNKREVELEQRRWGAGNDGAAAGAGVSLSVLRRPTLWGGRWSTRQCDHVCVRRP